MGLNENTKSLLESVADNDFEKAKAFAKVIINNETAQGNQYFCKKIRNKLETSINFIEPPYDLKGILKMEDVPETFNEKRYFLSDREEAIFEQISAAKNINSQLTEMKIRYLNSTMLYGESGTGKTTFGRYVAYKLGIPFAYLNFAQCISSYLGTTSKNIEKVFEYIAKQKCVFMIDEVDAIGIKRGKEDLGEMSRIVIGLMQSLDLLENDIVLIGATNRLDMIDEALIRRFSLKHEVKTLTKYETKSLIMMVLHDLNIKWNMRDIDEYVETHNKQSEIMNDIIKAIIKMLNEKTDFYMKESGD